jgi:hypothetical protein
VTIKVEGHHEDDCLMCAVRALTEGRAREWRPEEPGQVTGVVLRQGTQPAHFGGSVPFIELWLGGTERVRVVGHSGMLAQVIEAAELQVGDTATVRYVGKGQTKIKQVGPVREYKVWELDVSRGHG